MAQIRSNSDVFKQKLTRWTILVLVGLIGLSAAGYAAWRASWAFLERSKWSNLETVQVFGLNRLSEKEIIRATQLKRNLNLMRLDLNQIAARVEKNPGVASARIIRKLPCRIVIKVEERRPVAAMFSSGLWLIDEGGFLFPTTGPGEVVDVPVFTGDFEISKKGATSLKRAARLTADIQEGFPSVYDHLAEISLQSGRFGLRLQDGGAKILAPDPTSDATLSKLEQFLLQKGKEIPVGCEYVDLRYPATVITGTEG